LEDRRIVVLPFSEDYYAVYGKRYETAEQTPGHNILHDKKFGTTLFIMSENEFQKLKWIHQQTRAWKCTGFDINQIKTIIETTPDFDERPDFVEISL